MKPIFTLLAGLLVLGGLPAVAQQLIPQQYQYQDDSLGNDQLRLLTQITQPAASLRLYFVGTQLGAGSYLVLEGTNGARQELRQHDLENWRYSSAYFNGTSVNVSLFSARGDRNVVRISGVKVSTPSAGTGAQQEEANARQAATTEVAYPYAKAVGRFTNGSEAYGTGWIAPNGAIVTAQSITYLIYSEGYDVIEFNVPLSVGTTVQHPAPQDQYPVELRNTDGYQQFKFMRLTERGIRAHWAIVEALPNGTGMRPGERQQEYFRIATNPSNYIIDAMGDVPVELFHYASQPYFGNLAGSGIHRTLQLTQTELLKQHTHLPPPENSDFADRDLFVLYNMPPFIGSHEGAPIAYEGSNVAIGVHNEIEESYPSYGLGFRDDDFRNGLARFFFDNAVYVDPEGLYDPGNGEIHKPYLTENQAASDAPAGAQVYFAGGEYYGPVTFDRPMTLRAPVGKVTMGLPYSNARRGVVPSIARDVAIAETRQAQVPLGNQEKMGGIAAYPNPFSEQTEIKYQSVEGGPLSVRIFNTAGVLVATFTPKDAGFGQTGVQWNGIDQHGTPVPSGIYLVQINDGHQTVTIKVLKQ